MLYAGVFRRYSKIRFIVAHCGGALPVLSGRLKLLGTESWVPNPNKITQDEIREQLARLYLNTSDDCSDWDGAGVAYGFAGSFGVWCRLWCPLLDRVHYGGEQEGCP